MDVMSISTLLVFDFPAILEKSSYRIKVELELFLIDFNIDDCKIPAHAA